MKNSASYTWTLLLVDDEEPVSFFLKRLLELEGFTVLTASNGHEAVEFYKANKNSIDLILMDIVMPIMSGIEAVAEIKRFDPSVPALLMSAYDKDSFEGISQLHFIRKPMMPNDLISTINGLLVENICESNSQLPEFVSPCMKDISHD